MGGLEWQIGKIGLDCTAIKNHRFLKSALR